MALGYCNQCGNKIGRRSANGVYIPDQSKTRQAVLIFGYQHTSKKTKVHVAVCTACVKSLDYNKISLGLNDDASFMEFLKSLPDGASFEGAVEEVLR